MTALPPGLWRVILLGCAGFFFGGMLAATAMSGLN